MAHIPWRGLSLRDNDSRSDHIQPMINVGQAWPASKRKSWLTTTVAIPNDHQKFLVHALWPRCHEGEDSNLLSATDHVTVRPSWFATVRARLGVEEHDPMSAPTLSALMSTLTNAMPPSLLRGWAEIAAFTRKSPCQLRRYARREGLPVARWGRHIYSDRTAIVVWLLRREQRRRERKRSANQF
jgi:hypothetical protein